jgi:hypothetical protein
MDASRGSECSLSGTALQFHFSGQEKAREQSTSHESVTAVTLKSLQRGVTDIT